MEGVKMKVKIQCPRCGNRFKREFNTKILKGIETTCPFCSKVFDIHRDLRKSYIIGVEE